MRRKVIPLILTIVFLLPGCMVQNIEPIFTPPDYSYSTHASEHETKYRTEMVDAKKLNEGLPVFALHEWAAPLKMTKFQGLIKDPTWRYDLRSCDASIADLSSITNYNDISFDTRTKWSKQLPTGFSPSEILDYNKNPGLGIRELHKQGITGSGVGIAIIDQALLTEHEQYKDNLMLYEHIHCSDTQPPMHGAAVASIAVGKDIGVAPGAKLYYIASTFGHYTADTYVFDASIIADCILRVLELNHQLPENEKIKVISISKGYAKSNIGYEQIANAIKLADKANILVLTTSTNEYYDFNLWGMGREYQDDPDDINSYIPIDWAANAFYSHPNSYRNRYLVPLGSRTYASSNGNWDYEISNSGGMSWGVPWFAGLYALCCQVKPDITPKEFIMAVKNTSITTKIEHDGKIYKFGKIVNPSATIELLKKK